MLYACDGRWWDHHINAVRSSGFGGQLWTQDAQAACAHQLHRIPGEQLAGLCRKPGLIHFGQSSGYQSINCAFHWGARRLLLLGFDCMSTGKTHWFGRHPGVMEQTHPYSAWIRNFTQLAADLAVEGVEVINCSPVSALRCWPKLPLETVLARLPADSGAALLPA